MKNTKTRAQLILRNAVEKLKKNKDDLDLTDEEFDNIYIRLSEACETHESSVAALKHIEQVANGDDE